MDYVNYIRDLVGTNKIIMNAAACIITNEDNQFYSNFEVTTISGGYLVA